MKNRCVATTDLFLIMYCMAHIELRTLKYVELNNFILNLQINTR